MTPLQAVTSRRGMEKGNMMRYMIRSWRDGARSRKRWREGGKTGPDKGGGYEKDGYVSQYAQMTEEPIPKLIARLSVPTILSMRWLRISLTWWTRPSSGSWEPARARRWA